MRNDNESITPEVFINTVFPPELRRGDETPLIAVPKSFVNAHGMTVNYFAQRGATSRALRSVRAGGDAWYYCVSTVQPRPDGAVKRTYDDIATAWVLPLDDIGTKNTREPAVEPSYIIETSEGNHQWGYLIDPYPVSSGVGAGYYDDCLASCARAGINDPGNRTAMRMVRLPGSLHKTGFVARVTHFNPDAVWELPELMTALGVSVTPGRRVKGTPKPGRHAVLADVVDTNYDQLVDAERIYGHNDQWVYIECPWREGHTDGAQGSSSTGYSPLDYGRAGRQFHCFHGHCSDRDIGDFLTWSAQRILSSINQTTLVTQFRDTNQ